MTTINDMIDYHFAYTRVAFNDSRHGPKNPFLRKFDEGLNSLNSLIDSVTPQAGTMRLSKEEKIEQQDQELYNLIKKAFTIPEAKYEIQKYQKTMTQAERFEGFKFAFEEAFDLRQAFSSHAMNLVKQQGPPPFQGLVSLHDFYDTTKLLENETPTPKQVAAVFRRYATLVEETSKNMKKNYDERTLDIHVKLQRCEQEVFKMVWLLEAIDRLDHNTKLYSTIEESGVINGLRSGVCTGVESSLNWQGFLNNDREQHAAFDETLRKSQDQISKTISKLTV